MRQPKPFYRRQTHTYYVQIDGHQHNLGADREEAYRRWHLLMAGVDDFVEITREPVTIKQLVKSYLGWQDSHKKLAPRTKTWYRGHLKSFESVAGDRLASKVTQADVDQWFNKCGNGWGENYRLGCYRALSRLYNWGRSRGLVTVNPVRDMERPSYEPRDCYLTNDQWLTIIGATKNVELRDLLLFLKHTGCRPFEARLAEARHFDGRSIVFERDESKGKKTRRVLILDEFALALVRTRIEKQGDGHIFRKLNGTPWNTHNLNHCCARLAKRVKIPFSPYVLRHTAASNLLVSTRDAVTTAAILGHTDVNMLSRVYGHLDKHPEHLKRILDDVNGA